MPQQNWMTLALLIGCFGVISIAPQMNGLIPELGTEKLQTCLKKGNTNYIVADHFYGIINATKHFEQKANETGNYNSICATPISNACKIFDAVKDICDPSPPSICSNTVQQIQAICVNSPPNICQNMVQAYQISNLCTSQQDTCKNMADTVKRFCTTSVSNICRKIESDDCIIFLQRNQTKHKIFWKNWPQVERNDSDLLLYVPKANVKENVTLHILAGKIPFDTKQADKRYFQNGPVYSATLCGRDAKYNAQFCSGIGFNDKYTINTTNKMSCINCDNPIKDPDEKIEVNITLQTPLENKDGVVDASGAAQIVDKLKDCISLMNGTSAQLSVGKGIEGLIVKSSNPKEVEEVSFGYQTPKDKIKIVENQETLATFSRSLSVSKEAFEKAVSLNITVPFAVILRILNISQDENNSTVLGNEVLAIDMGTGIKNLTDTININFKNLTFTGYTPSCHSWDGNGSKPNWTADGCETIYKDNIVKCQCSHLTFFAVLLTPINETISSSDLNTLTIITQVGCGLSVFFLGIILFMYFLIRKAKPSTATEILIHLVCAMFLLNLTFLVNHFVANLNSPVGCEVMAAVMHFSMLATFSWFAAQGFHLCLQLYRGGNIARRYVLKVAVITWTLPSIAVITVGSLRKYGTQTIYADKPQNNVAMCWITDNNIHYIVNVGFYSLVFVFTFTTVIITLSWLFCLKRTKTASPQGNTTGRRIMVILGLCVQLGVTWGFAFFAYGSFRMAATYIFTILNSFQGFFLFIYYYKTTQVGPSSAKGKGNSDTNSSISTLKTGLESVVNPYVSFEKEKGC